MKDELPTTTLLTSCSTEEKRGITRLKRSSKKDILVQRYVFDHKSGQLDRPGAHITHTHILPVQVFSVIAFCVCMPRRNLERTGDSLSPHAFTLCLGLLLQREPFFIVRKRTKGKKITEPFFKETGINEAVIYKYIGEQPSIAIITIVLLFSLDNFNFFATHQLRTELLSLFGKRLFTLSSINPEVTHLRAICQDNRVTVENGFDSC